MMMLIYAKQHLSNIWGVIHEKGREHWRWVEMEPKHLIKTDVQFNPNIWKTKND